MNKVTYIGTLNTRDGNPRRGWLVEQGDTKRFVNEGYEGPEALRKAFPELDPYDYHIIQVTVKEYRRLLNLEF